MTTPIRAQIQTPLEAEYKSLVRQASQERRFNGRSVSPQSGSSVLPEDVVTLSSHLPPNEQPVKLKPSQPVTLSEKQALQITFSVYG